jgi:glycosyltransferase involved in cell wall biosynthesis
MGKEKGNLNAVYLAKALGLKLDVAGGRGSERVSGDNLTDYEKQIMAECDGEQIRFIGEVAEEEKISLMQNCKGLLYVTNHVEITSHKIQECLLCGAPVIVPNHGGFPEIVTSGVDGFLCRSEYIEAVKNVGKLTPYATRKAVAEKHKPENVGRNYIKLFEQVANGLRWK